MSKATVSLKEIPMKQLMREVDRRRTEKVSALEKERAEIDEKIRSLGGSTILETESMTTTKKLSKSMKREKVSSDISLISRMRNIAGDGQARSAKEFVIALQNDGWKTTSENPKSMVSNILSTKKDVFTKEKRGSYKLIKA